MKVLTVNDLYKCCLAEISSGNGNKKILLADDEEGNGFHEMFYAFTSINKYMDGIPLDTDFMNMPSDTTDATHIILG